MGLHVKVIYIMAYFTIYPKSILTIKMYQWTAVLIVLKKEVTALLATLY